VYACIYWIALHVFSAIIYAKLICSGLFGKESWVLATKNLLMKNWSCTQLVYWLINWVVLQYFFFFSYKRCAASRSGWVSCSLDLNSLPSCQASAASALYLLKCGKLIQVAKDLASDISSRTVRQHKGAWVKIPFTKQDVEMRNL